MALRQVITGQVISTTTGGVECSALLLAKQSDSHFNPGTSFRRRGCRLNLVCFVLKTLQRASSG